MNIIGPKAYIHVGRLKQNLKRIQARIGNRLLLCVVKSNGYGHNAKIIARELSRQDKQIGFAVFAFEEAIELRKEKIKNKILIFSRIHYSWIDEAFHSDLDVTASTIDDLKLLIKLHKSGICPSFHLNFNTGMNRLGFDYNQCELVFSLLRENPEVPLKGIYSHFATADEQDLKYAYSQLNTFKEIVAIAKDNHINFKYIHCSNSGSILNMDNSIFNMVRVGMILYGVSPSEESLMDEKLSPVMSFCGPIVNIRRVKKGAKISYGGEYSTTKETNIGVVQVGFADGFPRPWFRNGYISYKGEKYKIAGRACMDQFMVDFKESNPKEGDSVLIFGRIGPDHIPIEQIAKEIKTTTYALLTSIHGRTQYHIK